ncbi:MAG: hypothetical protein RIQ79_334 [Verrucomicrobiota bacterium]
MRPARALHFSAQAGPGGARRGGGRGRRGGTWAGGEGGWRRRSFCRTGGAGGGFAEFVFLALAVALDAAAVGRDERNRGLGLDRLEAFDVLAREVERVEFFDLAKMGVGAGADEADCHAGLAGAAGAADAVGVVHGGARQVVIHHHRQADDVDAAGGEVGRDEHSDGAGLKVGEGLGARALA